MQTAIAETFKKQINHLEFVKGNTFSSVDKDGCCSFTLQKEFKGVGKYQIIGNASLWDAEGSTCLLYIVEGTVNVKSGEDDVPMIEFLQPFSIRKK